MNDRYVLVVARKPTDVQRAEPQEVAGLRVLSISAVRLRATLRRAFDEKSLRDCVATYIACARARGISRGRIRDALELFVNECPPARRRAPVGDLLDFVLRFAADVHSASTRQLRVGVMTTPQGHAAALAIGSLTR